MVRTHGESNNDFQRCRAATKKGGSLDERLTPDDQTGQRDPRNMSCREKGKKKKPYTQSKSSMYAGKLRLTRRVIGEQTVT